MPYEFYVYHSISENPVMRSLAEKKEKEAVARMIVFAEENGIRGNIWFYYLYHMLANDDNIFSRTVELSGACSSSLCFYVKQDIAVFLELMDRYKNLLPDYSPSNPAAAGAYIASLSAMIQGSSQGVESVFTALLSHYESLGRNIASQFIALRWENGLTGVANFDGIQLNDLIGIDMQKETLIRNTERLLHHKTSNSILLFGDSGTGKSSCVKALVNKYHTEGLRLLELRKHQLAELDCILEALERSRFKYIIFLDDLSFEEGELGYKSLKAVLEGKAAKIPENVLFYATSNRMHLIRETWADRVAENEEVHISDTMQEKLSLSERFGLRISFMMPTQDQYLDIVAELCRKKGVRYHEEIRAKAIKWAMRYNGFSGRTAKQFVSSLD